MREGTRKAIFSYLVSSIPFGTSQESGSYGAGEAVISLLINNYRDEVEARFMQTFGEYLSDGGYYDANGNFVWSTNVKAQSIEEAVEHSHNFRTVADALKWGAEAIYMKELDEGVAWLEAAGYVKEHKRPARFGYKRTFSITNKGWGIAHLYK